MNLIFEYNSLQYNDIIHIWRCISKFKKNEINLLIFFKTNPNQYFLTSLINKIDWMINKQSYKINLKINMTIQYDTVEKYLSEKFDSSLPTMLLNNDIFFTNQRLSDEDIQIISNDLKCNIFNSNLYGLVTNSTDLESVKNMLPKIWIFRDTVSNYYTMWFNEIRNKFLTGEEMYHEYRS